LQLLYNHKLNYILLPFHREKDALLLFYTAAMDRMATIQNSEKLQNRLSSNIAAFSPRFRTPLQHAFPRNRSRLIINSALPPPLL